MNPQSLHTKALICGWALERQDGPLLILTRDAWEIRVAFNGTAPAWASIRKPGQADAEHLARHQVGRWVRGNRHHMSVFAVGDRVVVGDRPGVVTDIKLDDGGVTGLPCKIRLDVTYDDGGTSQPYTTHAHPLEAAA